METFLRLRASRWLEGASRASGMLARSSSLNSWLRASSIRVSSPSVTAPTSLPLDRSIERQNLRMRSSGMSFCSLNSRLIISAPMSVSSCWTSTMVCPATDTGT